MKPLSSFILLLAISSLAPAAQWHVTPEGAGNRDGSDWENAFGQESLEHVVNETIRPGDTLLIGSGTYKNASLTVKQSGKSREPIVITGVDRGDGLPIFEGNWTVDEPAKGGVAIRFAPGVSHVVIARLNINRYMTGVHASEAENGNSCSHIIFADIDMRQLRYGFYLHDCDDLQIEGCHVKRYTKHAFRFEQGCDGVAVSDCTADCSEGDADWEAKTEALPFGFSVNNGGTPNTDIIFDNCLAKNNMMPLQKSKYKNGDGFVVEGNSRNVVLLHCRAIRNQDGGYDLKAPGMRLENCIALRNSRNFRIWHTGKLVNCFAGWGGTGLWCNGGPVTASDCTFHGQAKAAVMTDDRAKEPVTLFDCIISGTDRPTRNTSRGKIALQGTTVVSDNAADEDPNYVAADPEWNGLGEAMNSRTYPEMGYHSPQKTTEPE